MLKLKQILCSILVLGSLLSSPSLWAQKETKVNIAARQISLKNLIQAVEKQTDYTFVFDNSIPLSRIVSLKGGSQYLSDVLKQALLDFDGTLIVVSHDRDFLDGLVSKVYEFGHGRVREHLCGIYEFLESKKMENLQELEKKQ
mgnify:CR=1 FL=1